MSALTASDWIALGQSAILVLTIIIMLVQYRQTACHHREDLRHVMGTFRSQLHERILGNLLSLNRIMLEFPGDIKKAFKDFKGASNEEVRRYCYVYAVLDLLNYAVLHGDLVDPYVRKHLDNLAGLLYSEPEMRAIYEDVKAHQSEALVSYLNRTMKTEGVKDGGGA